MFSDWRFLSAAAVFLIVIAFMLAKSILPFLIGAIGGALVWKMVTAK